MDISILYKVATVALSVTVLALHAEGWVFELEQRQNEVVKTGSDRIGNRCECHKTSKMPRVIVGVARLGPLTAPWKSQSN